MAQVSTRNDAGNGDNHAKDTADKTKNLGAKVAEKVERSGEEAAAAAQESGEQVRAAGARVVHDATARFERGLDKAAETGRQVAEAAAPVVREGVRAQSDLAGLWLSLTREQVQHNLETLQRLGTVRDWRGLLELQSDYLRSSMARLTQGLFRQLDLGGRVLTAGGQATKHGA